MLKASIHNCHLYITADCLIVCFHQLQCQALSIVHAFVVAPGNKQKQSFCCIAHQRIFYSYYFYLTCAFNMTRVRIPLPIFCTYCPHPPRWEKPWVTLEMYLSSLSCVLINFNIATFWSSGITTVGWRKMELGKKWIQIFDKK